MAVSFLLRRGMSLIVALLGATILVFFISNLVPIDPARAALGEDASNEQVEAYRREMGLDQPVTVQYFRYMQHLLRGDLGRSIFSGREIAEDLRLYFPATVELLIPAILLSVLIGVTLGVSSAVVRGELGDQLSRVVALFGMSMPIFWLGLVLQLVLYGRLGVLPAAGRISLDVTPPPPVTRLYLVDSVLAGEWATFLDVAKHLILPALVLSTNGIANIGRMTRSAMLEVLSVDYIRTARSKGLSERSVIYGHAFRNVLIPVVTIIGLRIGSMFGGAVITETIFSWPGIGRYSVEGIVNLDIPVVMGVTLVLCAVYGVVNTLVDASYFVIDPRTRSST